MNNRVKQTVLLIALLVILFFLNALSLRHKTPTYDEMRHYKYGLRVLEGNPVRRRNPTVMPVTALNIIPRKIGDIPPDGNLKTFLCNLNTSRYVTVLFSLLVAVFIFRWTKILYGVAAAFFSLILYILSPNILAHSRFVTTDLYATGMITLSLYCFWRFIKIGGWKRGLLSAVTLGLSQLAKYGCVCLYPIFIILLIVRYSNPGIILIRKRDWRGLISRFSSVFIIVILFIIISVLIINIGFLFKGTLIPLNRYEFKSAAFKSLQSTPGIIKRVPVPLPRSYIDGLDISQVINEKNLHNDNYLFGKLRKAPFKGYFLIAYLYKVPIPIQIFFIWAILAYVKKRRQYHFAEDESFLLCPIIFLTIYTNLFFRIQLGIRYFIYIFPLIHIFSGSLLKNWPSLSRWLKITVVLLLLYLLASVLSYFPHYLSYFNELVLDRKNAYRILADSNLDWGQNKWYLQKFQAQYPDYLFEPETPTEGNIIIPVNRLIGIVGGDKYQWLRNNFEPVGHIAYSYLVYDVPPGWVKSWNNSIRKVPDR